MEENAWGFYQPCVLVLSSGHTIQFVDASGSVVGDRSLLQLRSISVHSADDTALMLSFAIGDGIATTRRETVFTFGTPTQREEFVTAATDAFKAAQEASESTAPSMRASGGSGADLALLPWNVTRTWAEPLPRCRWERFDVTRVSSLKNTRQTLLLSIKDRLVHTIRGKDLDKLPNKGSTIPDDVVIESTMAVSPGQLQVERERRGFRVKVCTASFSDGFASRNSSAVVYDLASRAQRELFIAVLTHLAVIPSSMPKHLSTTPFNSIGKVPVCTAPSTAWTSSWPSDDVSLFVGSWNVSSCGPPFEMDGFVPHPASMPYDVYAIGLQEVGSSGNRDAWGKALGMFLNTPPGGSAKKKSSKYTLVASESMWELVVRPARCVALSWFAVLERGFSLCLCLCVCVFVFVLCLPGRCSGVGVYQNQARVGRHTRENGVRSDGPQLGERHHPKAAGQQGCRGRGLSVAGRARVLPELPPGR